MNWGRFCGCDAGTHRRIIEEKQRKGQQIKKALQRSGLSDLFMNKTLDDIDNEYIRNIITNYISYYPDNYEKSLGFYFWGSPGTGKTYTIFILAHELIMTHDAEVLCLSMPQVVSRVKRAFETGDESDLELWESMKSAEILILDDVGVEKGSDWVTDNIYQVIDYRWSRKLPFLITSNRSLEDLEKHYNPQIISRIRGCCQVIHFTGKDRRLS